MKSFRYMTLRGKTHQPHLVLELSYIDIISLLFGRELKALDSTLTGEEVILRQPIAYSAFNMAAPRHE